MPPLDSDSKHIVSINVFFVLKHVLISEDFDQPLIFVSHLFNIYKQSTKLRSLSKYSCNISQIRVLVQF